MDPSSDYDYEWEDKDTDEINSIASEELHETPPKPLDRCGPTTWRKHTLAERNWIRALGRARSQNLSISSVQCARVEKRARRNVQSCAGSTPPPDEIFNAETGEERRKGNSLSGEDVWAPCTRWTAWPLRLAIMRFL